MLMKNKWLTGLLLEKSCFCALHPAWSAKKRTAGPFEWDRRFWETGYNIERRGWCSPRFIRGCFGLITSDRAPFSFIQQRFEGPVYKAVDCFGCFFCEMQCVDGCWLRGPQSRQKQSKKPEFCLPPPPPPSTQSVGILARCEFPQSKSERTRFSALRESSSNKSTRNRCSRCSNLIFVDSISMYS